MKVTNLNAVHPLKLLTAIDYPAGDVSAICLRVDHKPGDKVAVFTDECECFAADTDCEDQNLAAAISECEDIVTSQRWIEIRRSAGKFSEFDLAWHTGVDNAVSDALEAMGVETPKAAS